MTIHIFTTGGTIDKMYFDRQSAFQVGDPQIIDVLNEANVTVDFEVTPLMRKDSLDLTDTDRRVICEAVRSSPHLQCVVTHGTDTMIETARVLQAIDDKVIVVTGAMQPARFKFNDAIFNIGCAIVAVQTLPSGVYLAMNGRIFEPDKTRKNRDANRFELI